ncbi:MAG TPA: YIP1 family protein [Gemmatimonadales bacterium]|nr:YIP1 family protein [Gemmatimonadales bacterium]
MGQGIQQAPADQSSAGNPFTDVFNVLFEPSAVFDRVRARANFIAPFLAIIVVQCILFFVNVPYLKVAVQAQIAAAGPAAQSRPAPGTALLAIGGLLGLVIVLGILLLLTGLLLWVLASVLGGGEARFSTMLSVATYSAIPSAILLSIVGTLVLHLQGTGQITSPQDLQPALGLDLLAPGAKGFTGALLKGINPFSVWAVVLTGIGVSTTQRTSKSSGYTIAIAAFVIMLLIGSGLAAVFNR